MIQRLARCQRTPIRANVARMASPAHPPLRVRPSSKLAWAAICKVHRLAILAEVPGTPGVTVPPKSLGSALHPRRPYERCAGGGSPSEAASRPPRLKVWMALRAVWGLQPKLRAIL